MDEKNPISMQSAEADIPAGDSSNYLTPDFGNVPRPDSISLGPDAEPPVVSKLASMSITVLKGVGERLAENLARLDIQNVRDLLFHLPLRYEDRTRVMPIGNLKPGLHVLVEGMIQRAAIIGKKRKQLVCRIQDDTGSITLKFFHFTAAQRESLSKEGGWLRCFGEVRPGYSGSLDMIHPEYRFISEGGLPLEEHLTPVYPSTKGLQQTMLRKLMTQALKLLEETEGLPELLPEPLLHKFNLPPVNEALVMVHQPMAGTLQEKLHEGQHPAQRRLAFEELVAHQLSLQHRRMQMQRHQAPELQSDGQLRARFIENLGFELTRAQQRVIEEILADVQQSKPMMRLIQGDVGSGKTVVAAISLLQAVEAGYQAAIMAPTEILAEQHLRNLTQWLTPLNVRVGWLAGSTTGAERQATLEALASGEIQILVGTHALFQDDVHFHNLALVVVDEQHRFGVHQRLALREKGEHSGGHPHQMIMTATPIPRTLAMTAYADLDCSIIDELPPGRKPINTLLIPNTRREEVVERVRASCQQQRQAYWICTLVDESEVLQCQAAEATASELMKLLPELKINLVHGRMKADEKDNIMQSFKRGETDLLVATTVVEVGVDVPNANLMIVENPERLGLAQLHQLRGRVGRGEHQSHCVLMYQGPLSRTAQQRLSIMRHTNDGFEVARQDLMMRGPGEVLGTKQAGLMRLRIADLLRDKEMLPQVQSAGHLIVRDYPQYVQTLIDRWVGSAERFRNV